MTKNSEGDVGMQPAYAASGKAVVYKFSSRMCHDCQEMAKVMQEIQPQYSNKINFVDVRVDNMDKNAEKLVDEYKITLVPTTVLIDKEGQQKYKIEGLVEKDTIEKYLQEID